MIDSKRGEAAMAVVWINCPHCGKQTPEYLNTCFKCLKNIVSEKPPETAPAVPKQPDTAPAVKPVGWWECPRCFDLNPPLGEKCLKCWEPRPGLPTAKEPTPKIPSNGWIAKVLAWASVAVGLLSIASFFVPALKPILVVIKAIIALISGLPQ